MAFLWNQGGSKWDQLSRRVTMGYPWGSNKAEAGQIEGKLVHSRSKNEPKPNFMLTSAHSILQTNIDILTMLTHDLIICIKHTFCNNVATSRKIWLVGTDS